jgi:sugar/nucleoside kinase (ribokinase family)
VAKLKAEGIGTVTGKLYIGTAESIPPSELIDTTGARDAFIGAVIYGNATTLFYFSLMCLSQRFLFQIYMMY